MSLKSKKSFGTDGINAEILKLGAEVLVVPLTHNARNYLIAITRLELGPNRTLCEF